MMCDVTDIEAEVLRVKSLYVKRELSADDIDIKEGGRSSHVIKFVAEKSYIVKWRLASCQEAAQAPLDLSRGSNVRSSTQPGL